MTSFSWFLLVFLSEFVFNIIIYTSVRSDGLTLLTKFIDLFAMSEHIEQLYSSLFPVFLFIIIRSCNYCNIMVNILVIHLILLANVTDIYYIAISVHVCVRIRERERVSEYECLCMFCMIHTHHKESGSKYGNTNFFVQIIK